jgi:hypothetical protein
VAEREPTNWGRMILLNLAVAGSQIFSMAMATEAPSQALALLQYGLLTLASVGLVGSTTMYLAGK